MALVIISAVGLNAVYIIHLHVKWIPSQVISPKMDKEENGLHSVHKLTELISWPLAPLLHVQV